MENLNILFVYGTLLEGEYNHSRLAGSRKIAEQVWVKGELYDTGCGYPALYAEGEQQVYGELYEVNDAVMQQVDWLEGYHGPSDPGNHYEKIEIEVFGQSDSLKALTYVYAFPKTRKIQKIESGNWRIYGSEGY